MSSMRPPSEVPDRTKAYHVISDEGNWSQGVVCGELEDTGKSGTIVSMSVRIYRCMKCGSTVDASDYDKFVAPSTHLIQLDADYVFLEDGKACLKNNVCALCKKKEGTQGVDSVIGPIKICESCLEEMFHPAPISMSWRLIGEPEENDE